MQLDILKSIFTHRLKVNEVEMQQFVKADSDIDQYTSSLHPCIGMGFLNKNTKESYLLHTPVPQKFELEKKIETIKADFKSDSVEVLVAGGEYDFDFKGKEEHIKEKEEYIRAVLKGFKDVKYALGKTGIYISKEDNIIITFASTYMNSGINEGRKIRRVVLKNLHKLSIDEYILYKFN